MKCKSCGECCVAEGSYEPPEANEAHIRLLELMGYLVGAPVEKAKKGAPICKNYDPDTKLCIDYENRPEVCRRYYCDRAVEAEQ